MINMPCLSENVKAYFCRGQERVAGTGNCQVVVTASGKLQEDAKVWLIFHKQFSFNMCTHSISAQ